MSENCNVLTNNYDLHCNRLINSFMHRNFQEKVLSQWCNEDTITEVDLFSQ